MPVHLYNDETGAFVGAIGDADYWILGDQLEEESDDDVNYFINADTCDLLADAGASETMLPMLRTAVGTSDGLEVRWRIAE